MSHRSQHDKISATPILTTGQRAPGPGRVEGTGGEKVQKSLLAPPTAWERALAGARGFGFDPSGEAPKPETNKQPRESS